MPERPCAECGQVFTHKAAQPNRVCCSQSCAGRWRNRRLKEQGRLYQPVKPRRGETNPCAVCGAPVYRNKSQAAKGQGVFCSPACRNAAQTKTPVVKACPVCGTEMRLKPSQAVRTHCSKACDATARTLRPLERHHNGRPARLDSKGYVMVWEPTHPNRSFKGWQYEHRLVAEAALGRVLRSDEHVHHINGLKDDNSPDNLEVMAQNDHAARSSRDHHSAMALALAELAEYRRLYGPLPGKE